MQVVRGVSRLTQRALAVSLVVCVSLSLVVLTTMTIVAGGTWRLLSACIFKGLTVDERSCLILCVHAMTAIARTYVAFKLNRWFYS